MQDFDELERQVHEALRGLPAPRAPRSLLHRTMMAARARGVRAATAGTDAWRVFAAAALALLVVVSAGVLSFHPWNGGFLTPTVELAAAASIVMRVLWNVLVEPLVVYAILLVLLLAFALSALWTAFRLVTANGVSHS